MASGDPFPHKSDEQLLSEYRDSGQMDLLGALFTRYKALTYGVCLKYLKDREEAKDAVMQLFERLSQSLRQQVIDNFKGWLYVTARNHCLMQLRTQKRIESQKTEVRYMEYSLMMHPVDDRLNENDLSALEACIQQLKDEQRECVTLFYLKANCYQDIVSQTGYTLNQVKSYIQNGKRNLKSCMESHVSS